MKFRRIPFALGVLVASVAVHAADPIKIAVIDPLSGAFANVGEAMVRHAQLARRVLPECDRCLRL